MATPVIIVNYDPAWPAAFEQLRQHLFAALADLAPEIHHVGSTAIVGLAAKPILDIHVVLPEEAIVAGIRRLAALGHRHQGDLGISGREAFTSLPDLPAHHLYLCRPDTPAHLEAIVFRDYLRTHGQAAGEYARLKRALAETYRDDRTAYTEGKTGFVRGVLEASKNEAKFGAKTNFTPLP